MERERNYVVCVRISSTDWFEIVVSARNARDAIRAARASIGVDVLGMKFLVKTV